MCRIILVGKPYGCNISSLDLHGHCQCVCQCHYGISTGPDGEVVTFVDRTTLACEAQPTVRRSHIRMLVSPLQSVSKSARNNDLMINK